MKLEINENTRIPLGPTIMVVSGAATALISVILFAMAVSNSAALANKRLDEIGPRVSDLEQKYREDTAQLKSDIRVIRVRLKISKDD